MSLLHKGKKEEGRRKNNSVFSFFRFSFTSRSGFTLVELLVSVAIFVMMTGLLVAKYGNFNQSVLLTNLAYDVALTIRTAQTFGLSVKASEQIEDLKAFNYAYGVHFRTSSGSCAGVTSDQSTFVLFADSEADGVCSDSDIKISTYGLKRGAVVSGVCATSDNTSCTTASGYLDITFKRPDPRAEICFVNSSGSSCDMSYVRIEVKSTDNEKRIVEVRSNGQISVLD